MVLSLARMASRGLVCICWFGEVTRGGVMLVALDCQGSVRGVYGGLGLGPLLGRCHKCA
jgi:hypothetical protein